MEIYIPFLIFPLALAFLALTPLVLHLSALRAQKTSLTRENRAILAEVEADKDRIIHVLQLQKQGVQEDLTLTEESLSHARPYQTTAEAMRGALEEMQRVWLDPASQEEDCRIVLKNNLWVLWPEYALHPADVICERNLKNVVNLLFEGETENLTSTTYDIPVKDALKVDLCGWANVSASLQPSLTQRHKRVLLLIELKRPSIAIGKAAIEQTYAYAFGLMKLAASELWGKPIDCLAIGGAVDGDANDLHLRFGADTHGAIRITPLTYQNLIDRAHVICHNFLARSTQGPEESPEETPAPGAQAMEWPEAEPPPEAQAVFH